MGVLYVERAEEGMEQAARVDARGRVFSPGAEEARERRLGYVNRSGMVFRYDEEGEDEPLGYVAGDDSLWAYDGNMGERRVGYVDAYGAVYRFQEEGAAEKVGYLEEIDLPAKGAALLVFFGLGSLKAAVKEREAREAAQNRAAREAEATARRARDRADRIPVRYRRERDVYLRLAACAAGAFALCFAVLALVFGVSFGVTLTSALFGVGAGFVLGCGRLTFDFAPDQCRLPTTRWFMDGGYDRLHAAGVFLAVTPLVYVLLRVLHNRTPGGVSFVLTPIVGGVLVVFIAVMIGLGRRSRKPK